MTRCRDFSTSWQHRTMPGTASKCFWKNVDFPAPGRPTHTTTRPRVDRAPAPPSRTTRSTRTPSAAGAARSRRRPTPRRGASCRVGAWNLPQGVRGLRRAPRLRPGLRPRTRVPLLLLLLGHVQRARVEVDLGRRLHGRRRRGRLLLGRRARGSLCAAARRTCPRARRTRGPPQSKI